MAANGRFPTVVGDFKYEITKLAFLLLSATRVGQNQLQPSSAFMGASCSKALRHSRILS
jgi:hypothetical protein